MRIDVVLCSQFPLFIHASCKAMHCLDGLVPFTSFSFLFSCVGLYESSSLLDTCGYMIHESVNKYTKRKPFVTCLITASLIWSIQGMVSALHSEQQAVRWRYMQCGT